MNTVVKSLIRKNTFYDSLVLMQVSKKALGIKGVVQAAAVMATDLNKEMLEGVGLLTDDIRASGPNDLVISVAAKSGDVADNVIDEIERLLVQEREVKVDEASPKTLESALEVMPDANLVVVSVPGTFAKWEVKKALKNGMNVFLFSDGVDIKDELELKKLAKDKDLFMMGAGCGTAIINGVGLGFANAVRKGPIGIVGAAGTGIQEVTTLIHQEGLGISQAIGTGGGDLSDVVGGIMMSMGIEALEKDVETKVILLISKPPGKRAEESMLHLIKRSTKPVVVCFIGGKFSGAKKIGAIPTIDLEESALTAIALVKGKKPKKKVFSHSHRETLADAKTEWSRLGKNQKYIRGLFSGGTLCSEATLILNDLIKKVHSNAPPKPELKMEDVKISKENACIDMGEEEFTAGRPHPMIDPLLRQQRIIQEAKDPETAVILLDVVIGFGSHMDMAGELARTIKEAKALCEKVGRYLSVVASVVGTDEDPQSLSAQVKKLTNSGVVVMPSNAQASRMAALIASKGIIAKELGGGN